MPWFDSDWEFRVKIEIKAGEVKGSQDLDNFPIYIDFSQLSSDHGFWNDVQNDGGDIRFTKDDKVTEVPFELVSLDVDNETGQAYFLAEGVDELKQGEDNQFYMYYGNDVVDLPANGDSNGRNEVWNNKPHRVVYHKESADSNVDSTGNGITGTFSGNPSLVSGQITDAVKYDSDDKLTVSDNTNLDIQDGFNVMCSVKPSTGDSKTSTGCEENFISKDNYTLGHDEDNYFFEVRDNALSINSDHTQDDQFLSLEDDGETLYILRVSVAAKDTLNKRTGLNSWSQVVNFDTSNQQTDLKEFEGTIFISNKGTETGDPEQIQYLKSDESLGTTASSTGQHNKMAVWNDQLFITKQNGDLERFSGGDQEDANNWGTIVDSNWDTLTEIAVADDLYVFEEGGSEIYKRDGGDWNAISYPNSGDTDVTMRGFCNDLYTASGSDDKLRKFDGSSWSVENTFSDNPTEIGVFAGRLHVATDNPEVFRLDDGGWTKIFTSSDLNNFQVHDIHEFPDFMFLAVGDLGDNNTDIFRWGRLSRIKQPIGSGFDYVSGFTTGSEIGLHVNGTDKSITNNYTFSNSSDDLLIGEGYDRNFSGTIDEVRILQDGLSAGYRRTVHNDLFNNSTFLDIDAIAAVFNPNTGGGGTCGRGLPDEYKNEIGKTNVAPVFLMRFRFSSGTERFWTGYGDLEFNGKIFNGSGDFLRFSPIKETGEVKANNVSFTLSGVPTNLITIAKDTKYQHKQAKLWIGFMNEQGRLVSSPHTIYIGKMDVMEFNDEQNSATITLSTENRLVELNKSSGRKYTDEDQKIEFPNDDGLEYVVDMQDKELRFGPAQQSTSGGGGGDGGK